MAYFLTHTCMHACTHVHMHTYVCAKRHAPQNIVVKLPLQQKRHLFKTSYNHEIIRTDFVILSGKAEPLLNETDAFAVHLLYSTDWHINAI